MHLTFICRKDIWQQKSGRQHSLFEIDDLCLPCKISCILLFISYLLMRFIYYIDKKIYKIWAMVQFRPNTDLRDDVIKLIRAGLFVVWCNTVLTQVNAWDHLNEISEGPTASVILAEMFCHTYLEVVFFHLGMPLVFMEVTVREETCW